MEWQIIPYQSVGTLELNVKRKAIRKNFTQAPEVKVLTDAKPPIDVFNDTCIHIIYDKYDSCGAIEIKQPGKAIFEKKNLLELPYAKALAWFKTIDPELEETEEQFVSWKYGILFYAPAKEQNPETLADTITVFGKDFFYLKNGIPDPSAINSFHIHAAYVEGVTKQVNDYDNIADALRSVFVNNKENGFLIWNGIPVAFSYSQDLPLLIEDWVNMLNTIQQQETGKWKVELTSPSLSAIWEIKWNEKFLLIQSEWITVKGAYEDVLNSEKVQNLTLLREDFLAEWKFPLKQCLDAINTAKVTITDTIVRDLKKAERQLPHFGKFYQENEKVITTSADGRKKVDFSKLSLLGQAGIVMLVLTFVIVPVWLLSKDKDSTFWFWKSMPTILQYLSPFILILGYIGVKLFKAQKSLKS